MISSNHEHRQPDLQLVRSSPLSQDFASSIRLPLARAVQNVDSLSMYMTGAWTIANGGKV